MKLNQRYDVMSNQKEMIKNINKRNQPHLLQPIKRAYSNAHKLHSLQISVEPAHPSEKLHEFNLNSKTPLILTTENMRDTGSNFSYLKNQQNGSYSTKNTTTQPSDCQKKILIEQNLYKPTNNSSTLSIQSKNQMNNNYSSLAQKLSKQNNTQHMKACLELQPLLQPYTNPIEQPLQAMQLFKSAIQSQTEQQDENSKKQQFQIKQTNEQQNSFPLEQTPWIAKVDHQPMFLSASSSNNGTNQQHQMSVAAKAGEMQIFNNDSFSYGAGVLYTAPSQRKNTSNSNSGFALNISKIPLTGTRHELNKFALPINLNDQFSHLNQALLKMDQPEYMNHSQINQAGKDKIKKDDQVFQPQLNGLPASIQIQRSGQKDKNFKIPETYGEDQVLRKIGDYQNQHYKSRHFSGFDNGITDHSQHTSPSRQPIFISTMDAAKENSKDKRLSISVSQHNMLSDQVIARAYENMEVTKQSPNKMFNIRNSAQFKIGESDLDQNRMNGQKKSFVIRQTKDPFQQINNSLQLQPTFSTVNRQFSLQKPSGVQQPIISSYTEPLSAKQMGSLDRRSHNASKAQNSHVIQLNPNAKRVIEQRLFVENHTPNTSNLNIAGEQMKISLTGQRINSIPPTKQESMDTSVIHPKMRMKLLPEITGINLQNNSTINQIPQQFNHQQQLAEQLAQNSPKPLNIFDNKHTANTYGVHSTHFIYDYLFVQVSEAQYQRDYISRIKLTERISDLKTNEDEEIDAKLSDVGVNDHQKANRFSVKGVITPDKRGIQQLGRSQYSSERTPTIKNSNFGTEINRTVEAANEYGLKESNRDLPRRNSIISQDEDSKKDKQRSVEAIEMFPYTLQQTQFECLKVMTTQNITVAYNEQRAKFGMQNDENIDKQQILRDFINELSVVFAEQNRRFKVTVKKKYINDIIICSKGAQSVAQQVIIVVTDDSSLASNSAKKIRQVRRPNAAESSEDEALELEEEKVVEKVIHGQKTPQIKSSKVAQAQIARRGYESENEAKSLNSTTTTSSTLPQFGRKRGTETEDTATPKNLRKIHARSLSQIPKSRALKKEDQKEESAGNASTAEKNIGQEEEKFNLHDKYPMTKIKIGQNINAYDHNLTHPINKMFSDYNEFIKLVFKVRGTEQKAMNNIPYALKLAKRMGIQLTKNQLLPATLKVRENGNALKEKLIMAICNLLQKENEMEDKMTTGEHVFKKSVNQATVQSVQMQKEMIAEAGTGKSQSNYYKCHIGKGNNSMMVRTLFKSRFWWLLHDKEEFDKVNFIWTQLRKKNIMEQFRCKLNFPGKNEKPIADSQSSTINMSNVKVLSQSSEKFKKRKISSAQSKSPEHDSATAEKYQAIVGVRQSNMNLLQPGPSSENEKDKQNQADSHKQQVKMDMYPYRLYNKIEDNYHLANKKALLINMKHYYEAIGEDPFNALPVTFHVKEGLDDPEFQKFQQYYDGNKANSNIWIIKPGENTNRGQGIQVSKDFAEIKTIIADSTRSKKRTCIVQKYIHNPLLINRRKFDIRTYALVTSVNGNFKAYFYEEGYLRTSCREFNVSNLANKFIHLTNDAIQKKAEDYGKFEPGNKMSYMDFQNYLDKNYSHLNVYMERDILPQIKKLTSDCFRATWGKMDPFKRVNTFECYGLDFMIDDDFKVYLIEVNTNPCLELSSPLLARLIPGMVENSLRIVVDPMFPPPENFSQKKHILHDLCPENKYELVFDEKVDGPELQEIFKTKANVIVEIDEEELSDADVEANQNSTLCD